MSVPVTIKFAVFLTIGYVGMNYHQNSFNMNVKVDIVEMIVKVRRYTEAIIIGKEIS